MSSGSSISIEAPSRPDGKRYALLVVDDEEDILTTLELSFEDHYDVHLARSGAEGLEVLEREDIAVIIADQRMPGMEGAEMLERAVEIRPEAIRMMITGYADLEAVIHAVNEGRIYRYIRKPWDRYELDQIVRNAIDAYQLAHEKAHLAAALRAANERLQSENLYLRSKVEDRYSFAGIIGESDAMKRVFEVLGKVVETDATVLLTGETGTGKDLVAHAIHNEGPRKKSRFVAQNCGALPETLLESELFGHKRGAFTGAHIDKKGLFEIADGGTIFLDEIGETTPGMQVRLLRVLQDGEIRPLGTADTRKVDVRIVAATNRDLRKEVEEGRFREDLYYRLRVIEVHLPPLRERRPDVPLLAEHFLEVAKKKMGRSLAGFSQGAMDRLMAAEWTGNVRQLGNEIERAVALAGEAEKISEDMLSDDLRGTSARADGRSGFSPNDPDLNRSVDDLKRHMIRQAIVDTGSKSKAAERLGIPRQSLQKMMKRLGLP